MNKLQNLLREKPFLRAVEAVSGLHALIAESASATDKNGEKTEFDALWLSGFTHAANRALPDDGTMPVANKLSVLADIIRVSQKPVIIDCDTGGTAQQFAEACANYEKNGASAVVVEDKRGAKKNSLYCDCSLHEMEDIDVFCGKINAAKNAARNLLVFARIESFIAGESREQALLRAERYLEAGADGIVIHSTDVSGEEVFGFAKEFKSSNADVPLVFIPTMYSQFDCFTLHERGADIIIYANQFTRSAFAAMKSAAESILKDGCSERCDKRSESAKNILFLVEGGKQ